jgi:pSer/pThr/pTyr-binding forkhead associated (FHA) protein
MRIRFRVLNTNLKGLQFETDKNTVRVGRSSDNDLVLRQRSVSRYHALITVEDEGVAVEDIGSRNRTEIDGRQMDKKTFIQDGSIISFGDVTVEVTFPDRRETAEEEAEVTPAAGVPIPAAGSESPEEQAASPPAVVPQEAQPAQTAPMPPAAGGAGAAVPAQKAESLPLETRTMGYQQVLWPALVLILGVIAAALLTSFFLRTGGEETAPVGYSGVALRVGEDKVIPVRRGFVRNPTVDPPGSVDVESLHLDFAIQLVGKKAGLSTVKLFNMLGDYIELHVHVLPRPKEEVQDVFADAARTDAERIALAREAIRLGDLLQEQKRPYEASRQYRRALALLRPFESRPNKEYNEAKARCDRTELLVQSQYEELLRQMRDFIKNGDKQTALECLIEVQNLIPDTKDPRRQNTDLLADILKRVIETEKEEARRGL